MNFLYTASFGAFYSSEVCHFDIVELFCSLEHVIISNYHIALALCILSFPHIFNLKCKIVNIIVPGIATRVPISPLTMDDTAVWFFQQCHEETLDDFLFAFQFSSVQFISVAQSCLTLCDPMNHSTPGLPVHHHLPEFT